MGFLLILMVILETKNSLPGGFSALKPGLCALNPPVPERML